MNRLHMMEIDNSLIKGGAFEKEGRRFRCKIYLVEGVGLNSVRVQGKENKYNVSEVLNVSPQSKEIDNSLRQKQLESIERTRCACGSSG